MELDVGGLGDLETEMMTAVRKEEGYGGDGLLLSVNKDSCSTEGVMRKLNPFLSNYLSLFRSGTIHGAKN